MKPTLKEELYLEVLGVMRAMNAELLCVIDAGLKFYPAPLRHEGQQFIAISRATLAKVAHIMERAGVNPELPDPEPEEWYDSLGRPSPSGAYDAGGHYHAERDTGGDCDEI